MRLFIAVQTPFKERLRSLQNKLEGAKFKLVSKFHITLKFLGNITINQKSKLVNSLKHVRYDSFQITLTQIGTFPKKGKPRVIWLGVQSRDIYSLQQKIEAACKFLNLKKQRPFHPHITLARVKNITDSKMLKNSLNIKFDPIKYTVEDFQLIKSRLSQKGAIYNTLKRFQSKTL
ncbi:MAG: RNA 2',3'-cyclic phosphodiesterase [Candidatus Woesearchaeota archaeon]|nr:RNA 2',3'-cyclic phosphodiesterase [Candidatus Woesearchaeota archaeon]